MFSDRLEILSILIFICPIINLCYYRTDSIQISMEKNIYILIKFLF